MLHRCGVNANTFPLLCMFFLNPVYPRHWNWKGLQTSHIITLHSLKQYFQRGIVGQTSIQFSSQSVLIPLKYFQSQIKETTQTSGLGFKTEEFSSISYSEHCWFESLNYVAISLHFLILFFFFPPHDFLPYLLSLGSTTQGSNVTFYQLYGQHKEKFCL